GPRSRYHLGDERLYGLRRDRGTQVDVGTALVNVNAVQEVGPLLRLVTPGTDPAEGDQPAGGIGECLGVRLGIRVTEKFEVHRVGDHAPESDRHQGLYRRRGEGGSAGVGRSGRLLAPPPQAAAIQGSPELR